MKLFVKMTTLALSAALFASGGCSRQAPADPQSSGSSAISDQHDHSAVGPHHGDLIELGSEYHAEILHDETGTVTLYVLDSSATQQVPIDATAATINAMHAGQPVQFQLAASPDTGDPEGKSSRFIATDEALAHCLDDEDAEPRLVISIGGKSYRGSIAHSHDHEGHNH